MGKIISTILLAAMTSGAFFGLAAFFFRIKSSIKHNNLVGTLCLVVAFILLFLCIKTGGII